MAKKLNLLGSWAFLIGVLLAVIAGIISGLNLGNIDGAIIAPILLVIGVIVGLFNIKGGESMPFLFSGLTLIISSVFGAGVLVSAAPLNSLVLVASTVLTSLMMVLIPAVIIVAIKNIFVLAKN